MLIDLNVRELEELESFLTANSNTCSVRSLYDNSFDPNERQRCAVEGTISKELLKHIFEVYKDQIKGELRYF